MKTGLVNWLSLAFSLFTSSAFSATYTFETLVTDSYSEGGSIFEEDYHYSGLRVGETLTVYVTTGNGDIEASVGSLNSGYSYRDLSTGDHSITITMTNYHDDDEYSTLSISINDPLLDLVPDDGTPLFPDELLLSDQTSVGVYFIIYSGGPDYWGREELSAAYPPPPSPVPLPSTFWLFGSALGLLGLRRTNRHHSVFRHNRVYRINVNKP